MSTEGSASMARRRRNISNSNALSEYEADLTSHDRLKQKEAVRRYLSLKVKNDWSFPWPIPSSSSAVNSEFSETSEIRNTELVEDTYDEWRERGEWLSIKILSGNDSCGELSPNSSPKSASSRDSLISYKRKQKLKEELANELVWNDGLRCFTARRDAWTRARISLKPIPSFVSASYSDKSNGRESEYSKKIEMEEVLEIPIAPPIIPKENFLRSNITPRAYRVIYDKVIMNSVTPACPINLHDITRSCVQGWRRDGQWPPTSSGLIESPSQRQLSLSSLFPPHEPNEAFKQEVKEKKSNISEKFETPKQEESELGNGAELDEDTANKKRSLTSCISRILGRGT